jgi:hypothetical protein
MKRLSVVVACLVCLGTALAASSAIAGNNMNQGADSASSTSGNSSGGGY